MNDSTKNFGFNNASTNSQSVINPYINKTVNKLPFVPENFDSAGFLKGVLIGVAATYLLTNEKAQNPIFKSVVKGSQFFQAGMEEIKERFEDAKAELETN